MQQIQSLITNTNKQIVQKIKEDTNNQIVLKIKEDGYLFTQRNPTRIKTLWGLRSHPQREQIHYEYNFSLTIDHLWLYKGGKITKRTRRVASTLDWTFTCNFLSLETVHWTATPRSSLKSWWWGWGWGLVKQILGLTRTQPKP